VEYEAPIKSDILVDKKNISATWLRTVSKTKFLKYWRKPDNQGNDPLLVDDRETEDSAASVPR
jgi:hypothetical protein